MKYNIYKFIYILGILALLGVLIYLIQTPDIARFFGLVGIIFIVVRINKHMVDYFKRRFPSEVTSEQYKKNLRTVFERNIT